MATELAANEEARARFSREAAAAAAVKSPHVVQMFDHGVVDGTPFIVMELLEGEDLRARLERDRVIPLAELDALLSQACKALGQAHRTGIVHRDIKPDNIFLCASGDGDLLVKILDFGIAKKGDTTGGLGATKTGAVMGTPYYMSPEQALGAKGIGPKTDLWSMGVVTFEALTGAKAFDGDTIGAIAVAITHGPMPVPSVVNPSLPQTLDTWFARACARAPEERFGSAKEMSDAFHLAIGDARTSTLASPAASTSTTPELLANRASEPGVLASTTTSPTSQRAKGDVPAGLPAPASLRKILAIVGGVAIAVVLIGVMVASLRSSGHDATATSVVKPDQAAGPSTAAPVAPSMSTQSNLAPPLSAPPPPPSSTTAPIESTARSARSQRAGAATVETVRRPPTASAPSQRPRANGSTPNPATTQSKSTTAAPGEYGAAGVSTAY